MPVRRTLLAIVLVGSLGAGATAQETPAPGAPPQASPTLNLRMDHLHILKENLLAPGKSARIELPGSAALERGAAVPQEVPLQTFPDHLASRIPQLRPYAFFVTAETIVIVEPQQRRIMDLVK